jgi:uncharacterized protein (DUF2235 family)
MALYAFDGTGQDDRDDNETSGFDSNVLHFFRAYVDNDKDFDFTDGADRVGSLYLKGIGRRADTHTGELVGQAFGIGGHRRVGMMMDRLAANLQAGDANVHVIGFSRGAALAVSFANEVARKAPDVAIQFLGVWDIVGEFGLPGRFVNAGHDLRMPRNVLRAYHAMALDERRSVFHLTRLTGTGDREAGRLTEVWFRGVHSDVGGGNGNFGLNWMSLDWMYASALREGIALNPADVAANRLHASKVPDVKEHKLALGLKREIAPTDLLHDTVQLDPGARHPQHNDPRVVLKRIDNDGVVHA